MISRVRFHHAALFAAVAGIAISAGAAAAGQPDGATDAKTIVHVLNRLGFGPTPAAIAHVREIGVRNYVEVQLHPARIPDSGMAARLAPLTTLAKSSRELADEYFLPAMRERREQQRRAGQDGAAPPEPGTPDRPKRSTEQMQPVRLQRAVIADLSQQKVLRAAFSERQLEEVLVDFWLNHFNVFAGKGQVRGYLTEYERDAIRPHVLGRFRDLLGATARSPAMLFYLDNWQSTAAPDATTARLPSTPERLRTRRMRQEQSAAGTPRPGMRRRGLNENYARELMELHTLGVDGGYTQKDVQEVARAFTGWTIANPRLGGPFRFEPRLHDDGEKVVLGHRIKSGGGSHDGEQVLDLLAAHPSTARFIATKLVRRFVADDPPAGLVDRAARRFKETGGDLREVVRTIVLSPEFFAPGAYRAKVKNPFEFVVSAVRATNIDIASALPLVEALRDLGMPLYGAQPPTGYPDTKEAWVNSGSLLNRMNFAVALAGGQMRALGVRPLANAAAAGDAGAALFATALAGDVSASTTATVDKATTPAQAIALTLGSPEFQKR